MMKGFKSNDAGPYSGDVKVANRIDVPSGERPETVNRIPFNKPFIVGKELYYIAQAVTFGNLAGDGYFTQNCCRILQEQFGIHKVLMTPSCTGALEIAAILCDLGPGDEVILPSFTFVSTANAFVRLGAKPVFVDIRPDTLNLDENLIEDAITPNTKAIFPVHYAGVGCEMDRIMTIARKHNLRVVEDAAQGVNAFYDGRVLGSIGDLGTYSFHETKNYICGEGGALCINSPDMVERAEIIRDKGTNRSQFFRGQVDKYTWVDVGSSYVPSEICSAFLCAQLEMMDAISERRRKIYQFYRHHLKPLETEGLLRLPHRPEDCDSNYHLFYVLLPDMQTRNDLIAFLNWNGIDAIFHYVPLHSSPMGQKLGYKEGDLPFTEELSGRLVRLPLYYEITEEEQNRVVQKLTYFLEKRAVPAEIPLKPRREGIEVNLLPERAQIQAKPRAATKVVIR
ncbi:MAG TPA: dTDP-4-amino-4,6-dideoxygalactose transaminase [Nitrospiraceae bacterium]|jgi:dTDP-4-amino-4,6-dideoxygalactose transaminase|nr:dTDP-4-amino-4,6-dideoxygalactose transaminase [Nitrospiraceae bacterium]